MIENTITKNSNSIMEPEIVISPRYDTINGKYTVIKRDGRKELFSLEKVLKVIRWSVINNKNIKKESYPFYIETLLNDLILHIKDGIRTQDLYDTLIDIAASKISALYPNWDNIAKYLYLLKIYKENFKLKRIGTYPSLKETFLSKGIEKGIYDPQIINAFSEDDLYELNNYIDPNRDTLFNYKGLRIFFDKYCKTYDDNTIEIKKKLELPQITYMAAAMHSHYNEPHNTLGEKKKRLKNVMYTYDLLSRHRVTFSTPRITFGLQKRAQFASCVLITADDDTLSLNIIDDWAALYSKFMGGIAIDWSYIRSRGSKIFSNSGKSDGPIPFIKRMENTVSAFNQGGKRQGSVINYMQWWHMDILDFLVLKDAGGAEELRARKCKYAMKINRLLLDRADKDEYITLFDPKETRDLVELYGDEFEKRYKELEDDGSKRSKKIKARELLSEFFRVRVETGNVYVAFMDNINEQEMTGRFIGMSNLCMEISVPSRPPRVVSEKYYKNEDGKYEVHTIKEGGEIGLCNLSSVNILEFYHMSDSEKDDLVSTLLRGMYNSIQTQYYPVAEGAWPNKAYRPIGIGVTDGANLLAFEGIKYTDDKSLQFVNDVMSDLYWRIYYQSMLLAKEVGTFEGFRSSNWAKGLTPFHLSRFRKENPLGLQFKDEEKWMELGELIERNGVAFSLHASIPPSACQSLDNEIKITKDKSMNLRDFLIDVLRIDEKLIDELQRKNNKGWLRSHHPVEIEIGNGLTDTVEYVFYNGNTAVLYEITMEDGFKGKYTFNHKFKNSNGVWVKTQFLKPGNLLSGPNGLKAIKSIERVPSEPTWDIECKRYHYFLTGNGLYSHNTSGKVTNATESFEPIMDLFYVETGNHNYPTVVKGIGEVRNYYERCWDIPTSRILELAAIRQIYLDQAQSFNEYWTDANSVLELYKSLRYAERLGLKTIYYFKTPKSKEELLCSSCSS